MVIPAAPAVADLAADGAWAEEYLAAEAQARDLGPDWSTEFHSNKPPNWLPKEAGAAAMPERQWAQDFLARNEHKEWCALIFIKFRNTVQTCFYCYCLKIILI